MQRGGQFWQRGGTKIDEGKWEQGGIYGPQKGDRKYIKKDNTKRKNAKKGIKRRRRGKDITGINKKLFYRGKRKEKKEKAGIFDVKK